MSRVACQIVQATLSELRALLVAPKPTEKLLEVVDGLLRRSLIESGQHPGSITLQSVALEYVTTRLVAEVSRELEQGQLVRLIQHGLVQAQAKDYVRQTQERLLLAPVLARLRRVHFGHAQVEELLRSLLDQLRERPLEAQGYGPANLVALLHMLRGDLRGLNLSLLAIRRASLQGAEMQDADLSGATLQSCVFTETFDAISAVAISPNGQYWAATSRVSLSLPLSRLQLSGVKTLSFTTLVCPCSTVRQLARSTSQSQMVWSRPQLASRSPSGLQALSCWCVCSQCSLDFWSRG